MRGPWVLTVLGLTCLLGAGQLSWAQDGVAGGQTGLERVPMTLFGQSFSLEVARTPEQQATGLMGRTQLGRQEGMLFLYDTPMPAVFWMKNCRIPIDMLFFRNNRLVNIVHAAPPCTEDPCPLYPSNGEIDAVVELPGWTAWRLGLKPGHRATIPREPASPPAVIGGRRRIL